MARKNTTKAKPQARRTTPAKSAAAKKPASKPRARKEPSVYDLGLVQRAPKDLPETFTAQDNPAQVQTY